MELELSLVDYSIQFIYILAISSVLAAKFLPILRDFLKYGKTLKDNSDLNTDISILHQILTLQVPRLWFHHFYLLSLLLSFIGFILVTMSLTDPSSHEILNHFRQNDYGEIPIQISRLTFFLLIGHSSRRLAETLWMMKYSDNSRMNISHYLVGVYFYTSINLQLLINTDFKIIQEGLPAEEAFELSNLLILILFFFASFSQFLHHLHLSKVVKYKIPRFGMFQYLCCAHYLDEILIYTAVALLVQNLTSFIALVWVIVNLSVSALETKKFYKKNENGKVPRWSIIPFIL